MREIDGKTYVDERERERERKNQETKEEIEEKERNDGMGCYRTSEKRRMKAPTTCSETERKSKVPRDRE